MADTTLQGTMTQDTSSSEKKKVYDPKRRKAMLDMLATGEDPKFVKFNHIMHGFDEEEANDAIGAFYRATGQPNPLGDTTGDVKTGADLGTGEVRKRYESALIAKEGIENYRDLYKEVTKDNTLLPTEISGEDAARLKTAHRLLLFDIATAQGTGALQAPDRELVEDALPDVTTANPIAIAGQKLRGGREGNIASFDAAIKRMDEISNSLIGKNGEATPTPQAQQSGQSSQDDQAYQWLQSNPDDPMAGQVKAKLESNGYFQKQQEQSSEETSQTPTGEPLVNEDGIKYTGFFEKTADKIGEFTGIKKFGEGIGVTLFLNTQEGKDLQKKAGEGDKVALETLQQILDEAPSAKEVIGSAALTALNIATAGTATSGLTTGKLASGAAAKGASTAAKTAVGKVATGVATGAAYGAAGGAEQDRDTSGIIKSTAVGAAVGGALSTAGVIARAIGKGGQKVSERVYSSAVPPTLEDAKKSILYNGKPLAREALDRGLTGGREKLLIKSTKGIQENEQKLQGILEKVPGTIKREEVTPFLEALKTKLTNTPTPSGQKALESVDEAIKFLPEEMTVPEANVFKRNIYEQVGDVAFKVDPNLSSESANSKAIAKGLKTLIENRAKDAGYPNVEALNKEIAVHDKVRDSVTDALARNLRGKLAGVGTMGALIEKTLAATPVKTYGAAVIDKAAKSLEKAGTGKASKITKVMILNALREASDEKD